jgi:hypothetical protein
MRPGQVGLGGDTDLGREKSQPEREPNGLEIPVELELASLSLSLDFLLPGSSNSPRPIPRLSKPQCKFPWPVTPIVPPPLCQQRCGELKV